MVKAHPEVCDVHFRLLPGVRDQADGPLTAQQLHPLMGPNTCTLDLHGTDHSTGPGASPSADLSAGPGASPSADLSAGPSTGPSADHSAAHSAGPDPETPNPQPATAIIIHGVLGSPDVSVGQYH